MEEGMKFGSLFTGIGGLDLGLERAGMQCAWHVELDDYCNKVLEKHWPDVPRFRDVRECGADNLPAVDLICGGFPCQPVSCAGKRKGTEDERWLWPEFARIIRELRPRFALLENVPGLLSAYNGGIFGGVLGDLAESGYDAEWDCLSAAQFGAPHLRFRVFVVAYPSKFCQGEQVPICGVEISSIFAGDGEARDVADAEGSGLERDESAGQACADGCPAECGGWAVEPDVGRVADGVPHRVDRLRCLGNAVVPQVAEWIGRRIMEGEK